MAQIAEILGYSNDVASFQKRFGERKKFLNETYVDKKTMQTVHSGVAVASFGPPSTPPEKGKPMDTQASYAIPLGFDLIEPQHKEAFMENFVGTITRENTDDQGAVHPPNSLMTGFIGTASISRALSENGRDDLAYQMLQQETYPSWLYPVVNGATTIWERLNSYTNEAGFGGNNSMNSLIIMLLVPLRHGCMNISGIQRDPAHPGFKHFVLRPTPDPTGK
ncbi:MAG: hypothetical protein R3B93_05275 [Bacteroidia bacterium]